MVSKIKLCCAGSAWSRSGDGMGLTEIAVSPDVCVYVYVCVWGGDGVTSLRVLSGADAPNPGMTRASSDFFIPLNPSSLLSLYHGAMLCHSPAFLLYFCFNHVAIRTQKLVYQHN